MVRDTRIDGITRQNVKWSVGTESSGPAEPKLGQESKWRLCQHEFSGGSPGQARLNESLTVQRQLFIG